jgi:hypothetical protein
MPIGGAAKMRRLGWLIAAPILMITACSFPLFTGGVDIEGTKVASTIFPLQTALVEKQTAEAVPLPTLTASITPPPTRTPPPTGTPKHPVVTALSLCWTGPGPVYRVVSSVKPGTSVQLLGIGSKTGWFVIQNPTYGERCWIEAKNLKLDPNENLSALQLFNPPPTPGPSITPGPSPTPKE